MNRLVFCLLCVIAPWLSTAQVISRSAFNKLIKQDIRYAILGDQATATGVKVDFGKENNVSITGPLMTTKRGIWTFSLQGGNRNGLLSIINEGRIAEGLAGVNFHVIPKLSRRGVDPKLAPITRYLLKTDSLNLVRMSDSLEVLGCFIQFYRPALWQSLTKWRHSWYGSLISRNDVKIIYKQWEVDSCKNCLNDPNRFDIAAHYTKTYFNQTITTAPATSTALIAKPIDEPRLVSDLQSLADRVANVNRIRVDHEIAIAERTQVFGTRKYIWLTFSAAGGGKNLRYVNQINRLTVDTTRFTPSATIWVNRYRSTRRHYWLLRFGPAFNMDFVPTSTMAVSYTTTATLGKDGQQQPVMTNTEGKQLFLDKVHHTALLEASLESYLISKSRSALGVFGQARYRYTPLLNYSELQVDAGPTFNVPSPTKSRSVLTLLLYARLSNLLPTYQNPLQREGIVPIRERWFGGLRIGIPIDIIKEDR